MKNIFIGCVVVFFLLLLSLSSGSSRNNDSYSSAENTINSSEREIRSLEKEISYLKRCLRECGEASEEALNNLEYRYYQEAYNDLDSVDRNCFVSVGI